MITVIREIRRAKHMTLEDVARACDPPTTAQTIGRLETGSRTVTVTWLNRIATAMGVDAADLVKLPERADLPVVAELYADHPRAPKEPAKILPPRPEPGMVAITVQATQGEYREGDVLWCERLPPTRFDEGINRDVLIPRAAGGFLFARLFGRERRGPELEMVKLYVLPPGQRDRPQTIESPAWIACPVKLIRPL